MQEFRDCVQVNKGLVTATAEVPRGRGTDCVAQRLREAAMLGSISVLSTTGERGMTVGVEMRLVVANQFTRARPRATQIHP